MFDIGLLFDIYRTEPTIKSEKEKNGYAQM